MAALGLLETGVPFRLFFFSSRDFMSSLILNGQVLVSLMPLFKVVESNSTLAIFFHSRWSSGNLLDAVNRGCEV